MESHGSGGVTQITRATYELIGNDFVCEPHGMLNVKSKGEMEVWHVMAAKKAHCSALPEPRPGAEKP